MSTIIKKLLKKEKIKSNIALGLIISTLGLGAAYPTIKSSINGWKTIKPLKPSRDVLELIVKNDSTNSNYAAIEYLRENQEVLEQFRNYEGLMILQNLFPPGQTTISDPLSQLETVQSSDILESVTFLSDKPLSENLY